MLTIHQSRIRFASAAIGALTFFSTITAASAETVVKWLHLELNPAYVKIWRDIADKYQAGHPGVKIEMQFLENEAFKAKLPTLLQSRDAPDFFYSWGGGVLKQQQSTGALKDLAEAMNANGGAWGKTYNPAALKGMAFDGKVGAVPFKMGVVSFFYNKAYFAKAGVDAGGIKTWGDFLGAVKKLKDAGIVPIAGGGGEKWPIHFYWSYLVMRNAGQQGFNAMKNGEGDGFVAPAAIKAGEQLAALGKLEPFQPGYLSTTWPQALGVFGDGKAAMILGFETTETFQRRNAGDGKGLASDNIGRFVFPVVEGGAGAATDTLGGINAWAVTAKAPPETLDFLAYLTNAENERLMAQAGMILPVAAGAEDGVTNPLLGESAKQLKGSTWHQNFFDQELGPSVGRVVNDTSVAIVSGQMSPKDGAQTIQEAIELEKM
ncbi:ABC transporter substrate-binding protein [Rhizobium puerariae]|uniref:ABC transporter substrate-binding protein n=1 Tax=Rhizobium puerariae TaxID=1585791 RepID=A0ABV6ARA9_9HYPH